MLPDDRSPPPVPPPPALDYSPPGPPAKSQWWTDEDAYGAAIVYGLLALMALGAALGGVWWLVSHFVLPWFGW
jgi:hypothetical protein